MNGYSDPIRSEERSMNPEFAQHQMRDPGLRMTRPHLGGGLKPPHMGGLGSLHHTMPHLMRRSGMPHFQVGGLSNPAGEMAQSPSNAPSDQQYRAFLQALGGPQMINRQLQAMPSAVAQFGYASGGAAQSDDDSEPDPQADPNDVQSPDDEMSPQDDQEKQIVLNAMAALDGQSPDPEGDIKAFIQAFGARALADLQQLVEQHHKEMGDQDQDEDEQPGQQQLGQPGEPGQDQDDQMEGADQLQGAGGGLLHGRGTGQSDEIEASTPSGHPVLLSDGEYVIDAPTVAALGDGSTKAGARRLDEMRKQIRKSAYGHDRQAKPMKAAGGGVVIRLK